MAGEVRLALEGAVAWVTLANPRKLNAMSRAMWRALRETFLALHADASCRCVVLQGADGNFCAGGDIAEYADFRFHPDSLRAFHEEDVWGGLSAVLACDVPVVAAIEGACVGAGVEIASCCDIRVASVGARFGAPIAKLGFPMAPRELAVVVAAAGEATVREMLLEAAVFDATTAHARGFLQSVLPERRVEGDARERAARIAALAPQAARMNKQLLRRLRGHNAKADWPATSFADAYDYADGREHREGVSAFLEKRNPNF